MQRLSAAYDRLLAGLALLASLLLGAMMLIICADVLLRNVALIPGMRGIEWSNEVSEALLYLITLLAAPWLLRQGQHIRVDLLLRALPRRVAWQGEIVADVLAFGCCVALVWYGARATWASYAAGSTTIKTLITPEWWSLVPLPLAFALLAVEVVFRMQRLLTGERAPRDDAVSAS
ncbi:MAG: TRAP transporter small permease [Burkholderiales bacterium]|nr:TRAP transporter small permease [Burkholderiales bacterium]OJX05617.1 MAG: C4-dicarboxylate ABC transporter permease [Burkholderiales bacterium 70-64]